MCMTAGDLRKLTPDRPGPLGNGGLRIVGLEFHVMTTLSAASILREFVALLTVRWNDGARSTFTRLRPVYGNESASPKPC